MTEGGSSMTEDGSSMTEGGSSMTEGGSSMTEGGPSMTEGGSSMAEGGSSMTEDGSSMAEGGPSMAEGGPSMTEGGPSMAEGKHAKMECPPDRRPTQCHAHSPVAQPERWPLAGWCAGVPRRRSVSKAPGRDAGTPCYAEHRLQGFAEVAGALADRIALFVHDRWPLLLLLALVLGPRWKTPALRRRAGAAFDRLARMRLAAVALVVGLSLASSLGGAALHGIPTPWLQDDFSYLLGAETLARGRVANPPLPPQLATLQVLVTPHYVSKYPPGQAAMLALGLLLFGGALAGMWVAAAAACAAIWWALEAWLTPPLALAGGLVAALHPTMFEWSQSYRGGALTALGGALLFGAVGRVRSGERAGIGIGLAAGIGISLLAVTRPFEGLVFTVAVSIVSASALLRRPDGWKRALAAAALPIALTLAALGAYDRAITGSALTMPYAIYESRYDPLALFLWQPRRPIAGWPNAEMATVYRSGIYGGVYTRLSQPGGVAGELTRKVDVIRFALLGRPATHLLDALWPLLLAPLLALPSLLRQSGIARRLTLLLALFTLAPLTLTGAVMTHYLAPAAVAAVMLLLMLSVQLGEMFKHGRGAALAVTAALLFLANTAWLWWGWIRSPDPGFEPRRQQIARAITARGGKQLVLVAPDVLNAVYNGADVDASPIVWAHDLGDNRQLLARFPGRQQWRLVHRGGQVVAVRVP